VYYANIGSHVNTSRFPQLKIIGNADNAVRTNATQFGSQKDAGAQPRIFFRKTHLLKNKRDKLKQI
jgi:hypothetical protein